jgi:uncharacterized protein
MKTSTLTPNTGTKLFKESFPYDLRSKSSHSLPFYIHLEQFTDRVLEEGNALFSGIINQYRCSAVFMLEEFPQSKEENLFDILLIGILWNEYGGKWGISVDLKKVAFNFLYDLRTKYPTHKPQIDALRGFLGYHLLASSTKKELNFDLTSFQNLIFYLSAIGDFNEEVKRLEMWHKFLELVPEKNRANFFTSVSEFAQWFKCESIIELGKYTYGVEPFLEKQAKEYKHREDYFFTGRSETEYHLNMVGAVIMNRSLKEEFEKTRNQVVVLPTCMVKNPNCQATHNNHFFVCTHCTVGCNVSVITKKMESEGKKTLMIKHSSDLAESFQVWANQGETGVVASACALNLVSGGYELKRMKIPSQCVFLDYCSCKKHWNKEHVPTNIDINQIDSLLVNSGRSKICC